MSDYRPGARNLITDVPGISVGNAQDRTVITGVTALIPDEPAVAGVDVRGGAPGTRDIDALDPACLVDGIHAVVLSGGSVYGLEAASGAICQLAAQGRGLAFASQPVRIPIVPSAILFDLANGGDKDWGGMPPYRDLGVEAVRNAALEFELGNAGAGLGATAGALKGGLGSASVVWNGITVGALVAVNSVGAAVDPRTGDLWARPFELDGEFGPVPAGTVRTGPASLIAGTKLPHDPQVAESTTIAVVATDLKLDRGQARRLAIMAADGMARALRPVHTPLDGDTVFALSTGRADHAQPTPFELAHLGTLAGDTMARAVGRAVAEADTLAGLKCWRGDE